MEVTALRCRDCYNKAMRARYQSGKGQAYRLKYYQDNRCHEIDKVLDRYHKREPGTSAELRKIGKL
jgi:hypothetical protein